MAPRIITAFLARSEYREAEFISSMKDIGGSFWDYPISILLTSRWGDIMIKAGSGLQNEFDMRSWWQLDHVQDALGLSQRDFDEYGCGAAMAYSHLGQEVGFDFPDDGGPAEEYATSEEEQLHREITVIHWQRLLAENLDLDKTLKDFGDLPFFMSRDVWTSKFGEGTEKDVHRFKSECTLGYVTILYTRLYTTFRVKPDAVDFTDRVARDVLRDVPFLVILHSRWNIFRIMCAMKFYVDQKPAGHRFSYQYDFANSDFQMLFASPFSVINPFRILASDAQLKIDGQFSNKELLLASSPCGAQNECMRSVSTTGLNAMSVLAQLRAEGHLPGESVIHVVLIWGEKLSKYIAPWLEQVRAIGMDSKPGAPGAAGAVVFLTFDEPSFTACTAARGRCLRGRNKNFLNKFTSVAWFIAAGYDVGLLDFDVLFFKNPTPAFSQLRDGSGADVFVSRTFGDACFNLGLVFFSASRRPSDLVAWLFDLLKKKFANEIFGYLARREFLAKLGLRCWIFVRYVDFLAKFGAKLDFRV